MTLLKPDVRLWKRFLTVWNRTTMVNGKAIEWDVVGRAQTHQGPNCVCVFPYHSEDGTVTVIKEYHQGTDEEKYGLPAGYYEPERHTDIEDAARSELSEESYLKDGTLYNLLGEGYSELKWCTNKVVPFLIVDPIIDTNPKPMDSVECIERIRVPVKQLMEYIRRGQFTLTSLQTAILAMDKLGLLNEENNVH